MTYDARTRPTAHRSMGTDFARQIGPKPRTVDFAGKHFVLTGGDKPAMTRVIQSRGGIVHPSAVKATDYLIIGDDVRRETAKIARVKELNATRAQPGPPSGNTNSGSCARPVRRPIKTVKTFRKIPIRLDRPLAT